MTDNCCENAGAATMLLACSGGSNVGQLANQAAVELTGEGAGKMYCLAGIGGRLSGFVRSAKDAASLVVIDGCEIACGKATLQGAGVPLPLHRHLVVTEYGIEKNKDFNLDPEEVEMVKQAVKNAIAEKETDGAPKPRIPGGCCG